MSFEQAKTSNVNILKPTSPGMTTNARLNITLTGLFDNLDNPRRWDKLLQPALDELSRRHPDLNLQIEYKEYFYKETRAKLLEQLTNGDPVDIVSVDQIWLGDFAERGLLNNLTDNFLSWNETEMYEANLDGCIYNNTIYGIWLWTDVRGIW